MPDNIQKYLDAYNTLSQDEKAYIRYVQTGTDAFPLRYEEWISLTPCDNCGCRVGHDAQC